MRFLPVVERELRAAARSSRFYFSRSLTALISLILVAWTWFMWGGMGTSAVMATRIFWVLAGFAFVYCLFLGVFLTADAISEEKREGTLGLLFLTDLRGYDVALGKLTAHSLRAVYGLFAIFPILTIPVLLGGVQLSDIWRMALVLANTLLFSLTTGLFVSACSRQDRRAQGMTMAVLLAISAGWPGLVALVAGYFNFQPSLVLLLPTPGFAFQASFGQTYSANPEWFWGSIAITHLLAWIGFCGASVIIRSVWQDRARGASGATWRERFARWRRGSDEQRKRQRDAGLEVNAYYWLSARDRFRPFYVLWFLAVFAVLWTILWWHNRRDMLEFGAFFASSIVLHTALKCWLASEAGRQFQEDRRSSALELTLSTPLSVFEILNGQFLGLLRQFGVGVVLVLAFDVCGVIVGGRHQFGAGKEWLMSWCAMVLVFLADLATISVLAMWLALKRKRSGKLVAQTLFLVLGLPWIGMFALFTYLSFARVGRIDSMSFFVGAYFLISVFTDAALFWKASINLTTRFREMATRRFDS
jgi:ABC-type transport system involved in multi-copper enzyme maturation permease subunit